jgi:hypothetical protein
MKSAKQISLRFEKPEIALAWEISFRYIPFVVGTWLSLVEHRVRDAGVAGSNPVVPTNKINRAQHKNCHQSLIVA